jgi:sigma-B regulation protein RsbU (phosphoserine phosphatase)
MSESKILFVDDEASILTALQRELRQWSRSAGLSIATAASANEALEALDADREESILVVVSDLRMPGMMGSDLLVEISKRRPDIITMLLTGYSDADEVMKAVSAGIHSYILKPWEPSYLVSELEKAIEYRRARDQNIAIQKMMREQLAWAGEMQRQILRPRAGLDSRFAFECSYRPLREFGCGGDYYDLIETSGSSYLLLIGDVSGSGIRSAIITGMLKAFVHAEYLHDRNRARGPAEFLEWLNERLEFELRRASGLIVTMFAAKFDAESLSLKYANAGHQTPLLVSEGVAGELPGSGPALGFLPDVRYVEKEVRLKPGDSLVCFTDGLADRSMIDPAVVRETVAEAIRLDPSPGITDRIASGILGRAGAREFVDDVTVLVLSPRGA